MKLNEIILSSWPDILAGMEENELEFLAHGSSRDVYGINDNLVIKIAVKPAGNEQNKEEATNGIIDNLGARVLVFDEERFQWVVMERATVATNTTFVAYAGLKPYEIYRVIKTNESLPNTNTEFIKNIKTYLDRKDNLVKSALDLFRPESWGFVERDGNRELVIVDYGMNDEIWQAYYSPKKYDPRKRVEARRKHHMERKNTEKSVK